MKNIYLKVVLSSFFLFFALKISCAQVLLKEITVTGEAFDFEGQLFFTADDGVHGAELWKSDGTQEGTSLVKDIWLGENGSHPRRFVVQDGWLYFNANDGQHGMEIWRSDGTSEGTALFLDFKPGIEDFDVNYWTIHEGRLLFTASSMGYVYELHANTKAISCINTNCPRAGSGLFSFQKKLYLHNGALSLFNGESGEFEQIIISDYENIQKVYQANDKLYLVEGREYYNTKKLGVYDPSSDQTTTLKTWTTDQYGDVEVGDMLHVEDLLFFSIRLNYNNGDDLDQLWVSKGSVEETELLKSHNWDPHSSGYEMLNFANAGGNLYFAANKSVGGGIWTSDGTPDGTIEVSATPIRKKSRPFDYENPLSSWNDHLYFESANYNRHFSILDPKSGKEPYVFKEELTGIRFLGGSGETFYFSGDKGIWSDNPHPKIQINESFLTFSSIKTDSCSAKSIRVSNYGRKILYFSEISISGYSFYLEEGFPASLLPGAYADLKIFFFPAKAGRHNGKISILSNDRSEPLIEIPVKGETIEEQGYCKEEIQPQKRLLFANSEQPIQLSNFLLEENNAIGTVIGTLSVPEASGEYSFSLITGEGDRDNSYFSIQDNQLIANQSFDFEITNILSLRIHAEGEEMFESPVFVRIQDLQETRPETACDTWLLHMDRSLRDVAFLNEQSVMAVGDKGVILKSEDGGYTWKDISPRISDDFLQLVFPVADTGFVLGVGHILTTYNSGKDWLVLQLPDYSGQLTGVSFNNTKKGYFVTSVGEVYTTDNGGSQWEFLNQVTAEISTSFFIDSLNGWLGSSNNLVYFTNNGGHSWKTLSLNGITSLGAIRQIQAVDTLKVFILTADGNMYKTENAGKNWKAIGSEIKEKTSMHMFSEYEGYVFEENRGVFKTTDGGEQWQQVFSSQGRGWSFACSQTGDQIVLVGQSEGFYSKDRPHKLIITGSGHEWQLTSFMKMESVFYPQWFTDGHGVARVKNYRSYPSFYRTKDEGLTWQPIQTPSLDDELGFSFNSLAVGTITTYEHLLKTVDGGISWDTIPNQWGLRNIQHVSDDILYSENLSWLLKSTDGGVHWDTLNFNAESTSNFRFINEQVGFIWGQYLYRTGDGGKNWELVYDDSYALVSSLRFLDDLTGFIKLYEGEILKTVDGGISWKAILQENNRETSIRPLFLDEMNGYGTSGNRIYYTSDGGKNWFQMFYEDGRQLRLSKNGLNEVILYSAGDAIFDNENVFAKISNNTVPTFPGNIAGEEGAVPGNPYSYKAAELDHIVYNWSVSGGQILRYLGNEVIVQWEKDQEKILTLSLKNNCGSQQLLILKVEEIEERDFTSEGGNDESGGGTDEGDDENEDDEDPVTGIKDSKKSEIRLYPNPVKDILYLDVGDTMPKDAQVELLNILGKQIFVKEIRSHSPLEGNISALDLSGLEAGLYIVNFLSKESTLSYKVFKK